MSQLTSATKPASTARQLAKLREIRKVKAAIKWHERARTKRQAIGEARAENKKAFQERQAHYKANITDRIKEARRNLREDYKLGPLRPNRAVGHEAKRYGALDVNGLRRPDIPVKVQESRNKAREAKGLEPEYPLVVDDKKYFHIAKDDRVVVIKGREKGKIGIVSDILAVSHDVSIKDINKHYADGRAFNTPEGEKPQAKREVEVSVPLEDVRLVVPYRITTVNADGIERHTYQDVIVDKVLMERHTTGRDPFTNVDYGNQEFPEEHRFDPESGLAIFNRYIDGTRQRILWPWEKDAVESSHEQSTEQEKERLSVIGTIKQPIKSLKRLLRRGNDEKSKAVLDPKSEYDLDPTKINELIEVPDKVDAIPRGEPEHKAPDHEDDTGRNKAEPSDNTRSFYPTLVFPPFPNELVSELRSHKVENEDADQNGEPTDSEVQKAREQKRARRELEALEREHIVQDTMKTPLQLRWEVERAKKLEAEKASPRVDKQVLMIALGQHIHARRMAKKAASQPQKVSELD